MAFSVPLLGYVIDFLKSPFGWALIILLAVLVIVWEAVTRRAPGREDGEAVPLDAGARPSTNRVDEHRGDQRHPR